MKIVQLVFIAFLLSGCSSSWKNLHDERFGSGCAIVKANGNVGYLGQSAIASACKVVCSKDLPKGYRYSYKDATCQGSVNMDEDHQQQ